MTQAPPRKAITEQRTIHSTNALTEWCLTVNACNDRSNNIDRRNAKRVSAVITVLPMSRMPGTLDAAEFSHLLAEYDVFPKRCTPGRCSSMPLGLQEVPQRIPVTTCRLQWESLRAGRHASAASLTTAACFGCRRNASARAGRHNRRCVRRVAWGTGELSRAACAQAFSRRRDDAPLHGCYRPPRLGLENENSCEIRQLADARGGWHSPEMRLMIRNSYASRWRTELAHPSGRKQLRGAASTRRPTRHSRWV